MRARPLWLKKFDSIPEVLSIQDVADFLRVSPTNIETLLKDGLLKTLPGLEEDRVFKGFLFAYLTQNEPKVVGLFQTEEQAEPKGIRGDAGIGF